MSKKLFLILFSLTLSACSFSLDRISLAPAHTATRLPTRVFSPTPSETPIPTQPTPTFTSTPTMVGYKSPTPTPKDTETPALTETSVEPIIPTATPFVNMNGFISIRTSSIVFYKGRGCEPTSVNFTVLTANSSSAEFVVLFTRFVSRTTGAKSDWTSITMKSDASGLFTYELRPEEMKGYDGFIDPWVQFQFVSTDKKSAEVGRTDIFDKQLSLLPCVPTETPTPEITPTVLKP